MSDKEIAKLKKLQEKEKIVIGKLDQIRKSIAGLKAKQQAEEEEAKKKG